MKFLFMGLFAISQFCLINFASAQTAQEMRAMIDSGKEAKRAQQEKQNTVDFILTSLRIQSDTARFEKRVTSYVLEKTIKRKGKSAATCGIGLGGKCNAMPNEKRAATSVVVNTYLAYGEGFTCEVVGTWVNGDAVASNAFCTEY